MSQFDQRTSPPKSSGTDAPPSQSEGHSPLSRVSMATSREQPTPINDVGHANNSLDTSYALSIKLNDAIADTTALVLFSTPLAMAIDMFSAGATLQQAFIARLVALPINIATSRPYGKFRDWCFRKLKMDKETPLWKRTVIDSCALVAFQGPLYAGILASSGYLSGKPFALTSIAAAVASVIPVMLIIGRPYGWFRNQVREKLFGLQNQD